MSKIGKDLGLEDMLGMLDADRAILPKQQVDKKVIQKENKVIPSSGNSTQEESSSLRALNKYTTNAARTEEQKVLSNIQEQKRSKTDQQPPVKEKVLAASSKRKSSSKECIFTCLKNFNKAFTRGEYFTSVRILKEKVKYLKLLFPGKSNIEIIDTLITECLIANRAKLKEKRKAFYDAKL